MKLAIAQAVPDAGEVERRPRQLRKAEHDGIEVPRTFEISDVDADVVQCIDSDHSSHKSQFRIHKNCRLVIFDFGFRFVNGEF
jgi:hypothetical protein